MRIRDILDRTGGAIHSLSHEMSVEDAIAVMLDKKISGLLVTQGEQTVGIFTERDVLRCHIKYGERGFKGVRLGDAMTNKLIAADAESDVGEGISMMVQHDIGHLPVVESDRIIGMVPLRDLAHHLMESLREELSYLQSYIADLQDAAND